MIHAQLEPGLSLVTTQPDCIQATFISTRDSSQKSGLTIAEDPRGRVFLFERFQSPAVFIEVIHTLPGKIRGNHVHQNCTETLHVVAGEIEMYLLCEHGQHVFKRVLKAGEVIITPAGTPHALRSIGESECVVLFDKDVRNDRERVPILVF